jgi:hypothetical protein
MTDCFHVSTKSKPFPKTADEIIAGIAFCNVLANEIVSANLNSYENAFAPSHDPEFDEVSKHYSFTSDCCSYTGYACANPITTTNPTWAYVQSWTSLNAPQAAEYYCT